MSTHSALKLKSRLYYYAAHVIDVYDGDTITVNLDLGMGVWRHNQRIRFWKINTPEVRGPEREEGLRVRDFVRDLLLDKDILLRTILDKRGEDRTGKFGRLLGEILLEDDNGKIININKLLLQTGRARLTGADGSTPSAAAVPPGVQAAPQAMPSSSHCPHCGEMRHIDGQTGMVEECPNCLDPAYGD